MELSLRGFLTRLIGIREVIVEEVFIEEKEEAEGGSAVVLRIRPRRPQRPRCSRCGKPVAGDGHQERVRRWRHLSLFGVPTYLEASVRRVYCPCTRSEQVEAVPWARAAARVTRALERVVAVLSRTTDTTTAARHFEISWRTASAIEARYANEQLVPGRFDGLCVIGVDEVSCGHGQKYLTIVVDLLHGDVVWIGKGRSQESLEAFFREIGPERCAKLEVIATDLHEPFHLAVRQYAPHAHLVFDHFHLVKLLNDALDELRREEFHRLHQEDRRWLKGTRWAILKDPSKLTPKQAQTLAELEHANQRLYRGYLLKEDFRHAWVPGNVALSRKRLRRWMQWATRGRIRQIVRFANTVKSHLHGILKAIELRVSTGPVEGMNNKIKTVLKRAYGFLHVDNFIRAIYFRCLKFEIT
jgi:transposase